MPHLQGHNTEIPRQHIPPTCLGMHARTRCPKPPIAGKISLGIACTFPPCAGMVHKQPPATQPFSSTVRLRGSQHRQISQTLLLNPCHNQARHQHVQGAHACMGPPQSGKAAGVVLLGTSRPKCVAATSPSAKIHQEPACTGSSCMHGPTAESTSTATSHKKSVIVC